jgi:NAD(P)-dependent dehydrogenase (short-subunit alcohol dehydrogenase family)
VAAVTLKGKCALVTGSSRGIGRGIALTLAEHGAKIAVHYYVNENAARETLTKVRRRGSDGFIVQADVSRSDEVKRLLDKVQAKFETLDVFVSNARTDLPTFYQAPFDITVEQW